jgi:hypothetical protein
MRVWDDKRLWMANMKDYPLLTSTLTRIFPRCYLTHLFFFLSSLSSTTYGGTILLFHQKKKKKTYGGTGSLCGVSFASSLAWQFLSSS